MNHVFIINPESGKRKGLYTGQVIDNYLKTKKVNYKIHYTDKKDDATEIANLYKSSDNVIYSVGGDGTLNEVVNSLANSDAILSIVPVGSGNDFYRCFKDFNGEYIDLGLVNNKYFINIASLGLDASIANDANKLKDNKIPNKIVYILSLIKNYLNYSDIELNVNGIKNNLLLFAVCNGSFYGGGFQIAPYAKLNDGLLEVYEAKNLNKIDTLKLLSKLIKATHTQDSNVSYYKTDGITVESEISLLCNVDGEIIKDKKFVFSLDHEAIKILKYDELGINDLLKNKKLIK
ncbi:MAG: diacylglycerol kinase family lipid kinase [Bacilli bacterium]|nr:diacylglycerol kinase family lipid kinase [Bacilli bacterium]